MKTKTLIVLLMVATIVAATERARFVPASNSTVRITGTSTLHEWAMEGTTINGGIEIAPEIASDPTDANSWKSNEPLQVSVTIPVSTLKSDHDRMTNIMRDAMKAAKYPDIRYQLIEADPPEGRSDHFTIKTKGKLTISGVTRDIEMNVVATRDAGDRFTLAGEAPIRMTDFGITPPITMLGALKTGDQVKVAFRWIVDRVQ
ncbi:MAG TPA: YceI family protein [Thermoanaerobaculia bacterium]|nr:YceI family protein [Thermoanaerobaculia bacterium]